MEFRDSGFKDTKGVTIYFLIVIKMFDPSFFSSLSLLCTVGSSGLIKR